MFEALVNRTYIASWRTCSQHYKHRSEVLKRWHSQLRMRRCLHEVEEFREIVLPHRIAKPCVEFGRPRINRVVWIFEMH